jgi:glucan phosphoethanolaminetransferase (alkaline phosphatase superfamily)
MSAKQLRVLRISVVVLLVLLFFQYESGMAVNIANPPSLPAFSFSDNNAFNTALNTAGGLAQPHAILGFLLWLLSVVNLVLSLRTGIRSIQILGSLILLSITFAGIGGSIFVQSGFANDQASHAMAANFIFSYTFAFLELYFLKGDPRP